MASDLELVAIKRSSFSSETFENGRNYYQQGRVTRMIRDQLTHNYQATIEGEPSYLVSVTMISDSLVDDCECMCTEFQQQQGYCKHVVALLLAIRKRQGKVETRLQHDDIDQTAIDEQLALTSVAATISSTTNKQTVQSIIQLFQENVQSNGSIASEQLLQVQFILRLIRAVEDEADYWMTVQLKVGCERMYVVKDIREFLTSFKHQKSMFFTRKFVYEPYYHLPRSEDEQMFRFLLNLLEHERIYQQLFDSWSHQRQLNERTIVIPSHQLSLFFERLVHVNYLFQHDSRQYNEIPIIRGECPILFTVIKQRNFFVLRSKCGEQVYIKNRWSVPEPYLLSEDGYCLADGKIYILNQVQRELVLSLHRQVQHKVDGWLAISPDQMDHFASVVLPLLQQEAHLKIDDVLAKQLVQLPLEASVYLDRKIDEQGEERITANIIHVYGDFTVDPLNNARKEALRNQVLVRDFEKEQQIMNIFEYADFQYNGKELYLKDEEQIYRFFDKSMPQLALLASIYKTNAVEHIMMIPDKQPLAKLDLDVGNRWLEFSFEMPDVDEEEIRSILQAFIEKKRFYRLADGAFVSLSNDLTDTFQEWLNEQGQAELIIEEDKLKMPAFRAMQLEQIVSAPENVRFKLSDRFRQLIQHINHSERPDFAPPDSIAPILRDYQRVGFQWLKTLAYYRFGGILADDMGLGKTLQAIALIVSEIEQETMKDALVDKGLCVIPALVVVPASLVYNWEKECHRFAPQLRSTVMTGSKEERQRILDDLAQTDILITSYPLLRRDIDLYQSYYFQTLILDEAQTFKNQRSLTARSVKRLQMGTCFALSGTPIENRLDELWSICDIVIPGLFPHQKKFQQLSTEQIVQRVRPFILRRVKRDVLTELPDKIESVRFVEMSIEQKKVYLASLKRIQTHTKQLLEMDGLQSSRMKILAGLTRLRQICCHPALYLENYTADSGKFHYFFDLLAELLQNGHRVLVYSQFTSMLALISKQLEQNQLSYYYLDGKTPIKERLALVEQFNAGDRDLFLISLRAGGTGLNLTGADTVILYDLWWNPAVEQQAADRAHRMGQQNKVQVIKLVSQGTIEEKMYELQQKKMDLFNSIIQPGEKIISSLNEEEIRGLLDIE